VSDYLYAKQKERLATATAAPEERRSSAQRLSEKERRRLEAEQRQQRYRLLRPIQEKIEQTEREIETSEKRKADLEQLMSRPDVYKDGEKMKHMTAEYKTLERTLEDAYFRWGALTKEMEQATETERSPQPKRA
jgi:ATP-binding cassette subfamily F protein 3